MRRKLKLSIKNFIFPIQHFSISVCYTRVALIADDTDARWQWFL